MMVLMDAARLERAAEDLNEAIQQLSRLDFYARKLMRGQDYEIFAQIFQVLHQEIVGAVSSCMGVASRMSIAAAEYGLPCDSIQQAGQTVQDRLSDTDCPEG